MFFQGGVGSQLHLGRHPALGGSWSELLIAVLPGEEHCFGGGKAWLTSHFEGLECFHQIMHVGWAPKGWPDSAWPGLEEIHIETLAIRESISFYVS